MTLVFSRGCRVGLLLVLLLTGRYPVEAQRRHPPVSRSYTTEDTVRAVRRLFKGQESLGTLRLATGLGGLSGVGVGTLLPAPFGNPGLKRGAVAFGLVSGGVGAGLALRRMLRFSSRHRDQVLAAYQQGEPLPRYVRRRLRPEHFQVGTRR